MAYNNRGVYKGIRITQFMLALVAGLAVGLINDRMSVPLLIRGLFPSHSNRSSGYARAISTVGSILLYPFMFAIISIVIVCCRNACSPRAAVALCFDAFGIGVYLATGIIYAICIGENASPVIQTITRIKEAIDLEKANQVLGGCLAYFAIQAICCAACIYLDAVYKRNSNTNREESPVVLNEINVSKTSCDDGDY